MTSAEVSVALNRVDTGNRDASSAGLFSIRTLANILRSTSPTASISASAASAAAATTAAHLPRNFGIDRACCWRMLSCVPSLFGKPNAPPFSRQRYVAPHIEWPVSQQTEARLTAITDSVARIESAQREQATQARQQSELVQQRLALAESSAGGEVRAELASLRTLLLGRGQFPTPPPTSWAVPSPGIPKWQQTAKAKGATLSRFIPTADASAETEAPSTPLKGAADLADGMAEKDAEAVGAEAVAEVGGVGVSADEEVDTA